MKIQGQSILVLPDYKPEKTDKRIFIPIESKDPPTGLVIDCGEGCTQVKKGDKIYYYRKGASIIYLDDVAHHFIIEEQVHYIYE